MVFARWRAPTAALLALLSLAALSGCGGGSKKSSSNGPTPVVKETKAEGGIGNVTPPPASAPGVQADPDTANMGGQDANTVVTDLGPDRYQLVIQNTSRVGYIDSIYWDPPAGATLESVVSASVGSCAISNNEISCSGLHLNPPKCLCRPGGSVTIVFRMHQTPEPPGKTPQTLGVEGSGLEISSMTPILNNIPSTAGSSPESRT